MMANTYTYRGNDMSKRLYSIRGATCAENNAESITKSVGELCRSIFMDNGLNENDIVNLQFTITDDLDALNPATALRKFGDVGLDSSKVPLFCSQEPNIKGMLPKVIRILVTAYMDEGTRTVSSYLNGAQVLRPDLAKK